MVRGYEAGVRMLIASKGGLLAQVVDHVADRPGRLWADRMVAASRSCPFAGRFHPRCLVSLSVSTNRRGMDEPRSLVCRYSAT